MFPIIDCHCHIYPDKIVEKAVKGIGDFYNLEMRYDGRLETLVNESQKVGITHNLIFSVATKPEQTKAINEYIAKNVNENPTRFFGLGTLHPDSKDILGDVEHLIELGLKGVKLHPDFQKIALDDSRCMKIFSLCEQKSLPVLLHTGDKRYDYSNPDRLKRVLEAFPNLCVIGAHFGGYSVWDRIEPLKRHANLYVDCSSALAFLSPEKAKELVYFYGADHVIYGTDYPMWDMAEELSRFKKLGLTEKEEQLIFYKNACKIFNIEQKELEKVYKN